MKECMHIAFLTLNVLEVAWLERKELPSGEVDLFMGSRLGLTGDPGNAP